MAGILVTRGVVGGIPTRGILWVLLCVGVVGCGNKNDGPNPPRVRVTGQVFLDGQPAPGGVIVFLPVGPGQLQAQGIIQEDGTFVIAGADGPSAGEYKVEIECSKKTGRRVKSMSSSDESGMIDERVPVIPSKYNSQTTLRQTITPGDNVLEFKLDSK